MNIYTKRKKGYWDSTDNFTRLVSYVSLCTNHSSLAMEFMRSLFKRFLNVRNKCRFFFNLYS